MSYLRGHEIYFKDNRWRYVDNDELTAGSYRNCGYCHAPNRIDGHDACLGVLSNVMNACCGHGDLEAAYIQFNNGEIIRGMDVF